MVGAVLMVRVVFMVVVRRAMIVHANHPLTDGIGSLGLGILDTPNSKLLLIGEFYVLIPCKLEGS